MKIYICHHYNQQLGHELHTTVNNRVISPFRQSLFLRNLVSQSFAKIKSSKHCLKQSRKKNTENGFQDYYRLMQVKCIAEHSAILSTLI